jgi:hypothetical protein
LEAFRFDAHTGLFNLSSGLRRCIAGHERERVVPPPPKRLSTAPSTPYYFTKFDERLFVGLIHRRDSIYSWKPGGAPGTGECLSCDGPIYTGHDGR